MKTYDKNINALKIQMPELVEYIGMQPSVNWLKLITSENGEQNALVYNGNKATAMYDLADNNKKRRKEEVNRGNKKAGGVSLITGMGMGYMVHDYCEQKEDKHIIIVIEPTMDLVKKSFELHDFSKWLGNKTLVIAPTLADVSYIINFLDERSAIEFWNIVAKQYTKIRPDEYDPLFIHALDSINQTTCNTGTVVSNGLQIARNDIECMPYVIRHRGINELLNLYKDKPCVLVSTGPSLARNIHVLKEIQDRVIIVAVVQALRPLMAHDIRPDFVCTVDFGEVNMAHFKGIMDSDVPLICQNRTYAPILEQWQGPKFVTVSYQGEGLEESTAGIMADKGSVEQGGSVAHLCLASAKMLGCNPIMFLGQDLALGETSHFPLADATGKCRIKDGVIDWDVVDQRTKLGGNSYSMGNQVKVKGYWGEPVITNIGLASFIMAFKGMIAAAAPHLRIYNCTEGGAYIDGAIHRTLGYVIDRENIDGPLDKSAIDPLLTFADNADALIDNAIERIAEEITTLEEALKSCNKALATNREIGRLSRKIEKLKNVDHSTGKLEQKRQDVLKEHIKHSQQAKKLCEKVPLLLIILVGATKAIQGSRYFGDDLDKQREKNKLIISEARSGAQEILDLDKKALKLFERYKAGEKDVLDPIDENYKIDFADVETYLAADNFAHPLVDARKINTDESRQVEQDCLFIREWQIRAAKKKVAHESWKTNDLLKYNDLIEKSKTAVLIDRDYEKSYKLITEALKLYPDKEQAMYGHAACLQRLGRYDEAILEYNYLINLHPKLRYTFELGIAHLSNNEPALAFVQFDQVYAESKEFDWFLLQLAQVHIDLGWTDKALACVDVYLESSPEDFEGWEKKAEIHELRGEPIEQKKALVKVKKLKGE